MLQPLVSYSLATSLLIINKTINAQLMMLQAMQDPVLVKFQPTVIGYKVTRIIRHEN